jgi:hypothetical protein
MKGAIERNMASDEHSSSSFIDPSTAKELNLQGVVRGSSSHNIDFCPVLATQCKWCDAHGHGPDDHKNFLGPELRVQYLAVRQLSAMASRTINKDITYTVIDAGVEPGLQLKAE